MPTPSDAPFSLRAVGQSALILVSATFAVQAIGIARELFVAAQVGLSAELDALIIGITLPVTVATVLTAGTQPAMVPAYMGLKESQGIVAARQLAGTVLVWALLAGVGLTVLIELLAEPLVTLMGPGLDPGPRASAVGYLRLVAPATVALAGTSVLFGACQAERQFVVLGAAIVTGPLTTLGIMLLLWSDLGLTALAVGSLIGPFVAMVLLLVAMLWRRMGPRLSLAPRGLELGTFVRHATPLSASAAILQLNPIVDRAIATLVTPGGVSALRFGDSLLRAPISAINAAWGAAIYPALVRSTKDEGAAGLGASTERTLTFVLAIFVPVALLTAAVAPVAVATVYGRGEFGPAEVEAVARVLTAFAPMIFVLLANEVLTSAINARRRGLILLASGAMNVILNFILDIVFGFSLGVVGIALSSTVTAMLVTTWKARRFRAIEPSIRLRTVAGTVLRATAAASPAAIIIGLWTRLAGLPPNAIVGLLELGLFAILGLGSYVLLASRLSLDEPRLLAAFGISRLRRVVTRGRAG